MHSKLVLAILLAVLTVSPMQVNLGESSPITPAQTAPELIPSLRCVGSPAGFNMPDAALASFSAALTHSSACLSLCWEGKKGASPKSALALVEL